MIYADENVWQPVVDGLDRREWEAFDIDHSGIVFISQHRRDVGELVRRIHTALERNRDRDLTNEIVYA